MNPMTKRPDVPVPQGTIGVNGPVPFRPPVHCPDCGFKLFDGLVLKSRIIRVFPHGAEAKCRCKRWTRVPVSYLPTKPNK